MDAGLMTWYAQSWINIPPMLTCETSVMSPNKVIAAHATEQFEINIENCLQPVNNKQQTTNSKHTNAQHMHMHTDINSATRHSDSQQMRY